ncbi:hypothetical protein KAR91_82730 [Candidatus Pacearchaeota archaeon]|nr:hypothetical protein [Candidatus Pacearchaeota archaeon]
MNSINIIHPYKHKGMWVFDDEDKGLVKEAFVSGTDKIMDMFTESLNEPEKGFRLVFSSRDFPGALTRFDWITEDKGGNWYKEEIIGMEGWLCPALFKYFDKAPKHIYTRFENLSPD